MSDSARQAAEEIVNYVLDNHPSRHRPVLITEVAVIIDEHFPPAPIPAMGETRGTMECPICGVAGPHYHSDRDLEDWLEAQASRFYRHIRMFARVDKPQDFIASVIRYLEKEANDCKRANGFVYDDIRDAIKALQEYAAWHSTPSPPPSEGLTEVDKIAIANVGRVLRETGRDRLAAVLFAIIERLVKEGK